MGQDIFAVHKNHLRIKWLYKCLYKSNLNICVGCGSISYVNKSQGFDIETICLQSY